MNTHLITAALVAGLAGAAGAEILVDFGGSGLPTASPDTNGNTWNNFAPGGFVPLVDTANAATGINLFATTGVGSGANGALFSPSAALLGDLAVESATADYVFTAGATISFTLENLDANLEYTLELFGTRATDGPRITRYSAVDASGTSSVLLQTSGVGIGADGVYNGNDDEIAMLGGLVADADGKIVFNVDVETGGFAYLGAMRITAVPAPAAAGVLALGGLAATRRRR